jgi:potassium-transporting ATPase potassium-binding subunit
MNPHDWLQLTLFVVALAVITRPMGLYLGQVPTANGRTWLDPVLRPLERFTYRALGVDSSNEHDWKQYTFAMRLFSLVSCLLTNAVFRLQHLLPLNPQHLGPLSPDLAFNTAVNATTNTNWQNYAGESTMSYFSQMVALTLHNFVSAAVGIGFAAALVRGIARHSAKTLGNFWVDLVRVPPLGRDLNNFLTVLDRFLIRWNPLIAALSLKMIVKPKSKSRRTARERLDPFRNYCPVQMARPLGFGGCRNH